MRKQRQTCLVGHMPTKSSLHLTGYLDDVASDIRAKSSFCGFTEIVGGNTVSFDQMTADSNVDGASINGGTGLVTVGAEASYQVKRIHLTGLKDIFSTSLEIYYNCHGYSNIDPLTIIAN